MASGDADVVADGLKKAGSDYTTLGCWSYMDILSSPCPGVTIDVDRVERARNRQFGPVGSPVPERLSDEMVLLMPDHLNKDH